MKKLHFFGLVLCLLLLKYDGNGQAIRTYSNEFLSIGVGARGLAMGNSLVASTDDISSAYWNPAGLTRLVNPQVGLMHAEWFAGIAAYDYAAVALPIMDNTRTVGLSIIRFGVDNIPNTLFVLEPDGSVNYDNISTFSAADYAALFSYSQSIKKLRVGANLKLVHRRVGKFATSWGMGIDLGLQYVTPKGLRLGANIKNLTTTINAWSYEFTEEEQAALALTDNVIPKNSVELTGQHLVLGVGQQIKMGKKMSLLAELDADITFDGERNTLLHTNPVSVDPHLGLELSYDKIVYVRAGINNIQRVRSNDNFDKQVLTLQPSAGIGINIKEKAVIDYALTGLSKISAGIYSHVISLKINITKKAKAE